MAEAERIVKPGTPLVVSILETEVACTKLVVPTLPPI